MPGPPSREWEELAHRLGLDARLLPRRHSAAPAIRDGRLSLRSAAVLRALSRLALAASRRDEIARIRLGFFFFDRGQHCRIIRKLERRQAALARLSFLGARQIAQLFL